MRAIITMTNMPGNDPRVMTIEKLIKEGEKVDQHELATRIGKHAPNKCCAIFYRLTLMATLIGEKILRGSLGNFPRLRKRALKLINVLPITKPMAFVMELLLPLTIGGCVYTPPVNAKLSMPGLWRLVLHVRPNIFCAPARIWIHLTNKITEKARNLSQAKDILFNYTKHYTLRAATEGRNLPRIFRFIIKEIHKLLGLGQVGLYLCFGEALPQDHYEFFLSLNIQIFPLRENRYLSGPHSICTATVDNRIESMGTIFPEFSTKLIKLGRTAAGRMFVKGRHVCMGVLHEWITDRVDSEGYLDTDVLTATIHDDLFFVGSTGDETVLRIGAVLSYSSVESTFKKLIPVAANCMLVGEDMRTAALLITLKLPTRGVYSTLCLASSQSVRLPPLQQTVINPETLQATDVLTQDVQAWCQQKLQVNFTSAEVLSCSKKLHIMINGALVFINRLIKRSGAFIAVYRVLPRNFSILELEIGKHLAALVSWGSSSQTVLLCYTVVNTGNLNNGQPITVK
ncbi:long-chain-fatty-acid--coa ligase acsbg2 [Plakobranchus ocellatus]|uniref:long-chain-fatty-acid--CoA ligase n=1 Tax=Plakobranchus ocellatus TaxID=259542 RepID=A0AAV4B1W7_9GAST|nr:long-chain-fatty-acid--coa ligase acsbg2 [Plakobranchus ocellatus]